MLYVDINNADLGTKRYFFSRIIIYISLHVSEKRDALFARTRPVVFTAILLRKKMVALERGRFDVERQIYMLMR